jgi:hypothetical protein
VGFVFCTLEYCVCALECYFADCLFEKFDLPNFGAVIREGGSFHVLVAFILCVGVYIFCFLIMCVGKLLLLAILSIVHHSAFSLSGER